ncbi:hypothetical protein NQ317_014345 [Molorchus minor]|uniref:Uncharacterized protein n=1 Tax=Molorchus minor TaxID=1323400 RepID=A0ABQ9K509_9CUCU|nr:hypothetical protein NQ317_014345 [Molorchus minor]
MLRAHSGRGGHGELLGDKRGAPKRCVNASSSSATVGNCTSKYVGEYCQHLNPCHTGPGPRCQNGGSCQVRLRQRFAQFHVSVSARFQCVAVRNTDRELVRPTAVSERWHLLAEVPGILPVLLRSWIHRLTLYTFDVLLRATYNVFCDVIQPVSVMKPRSNRNQIVTERFSELHRNLSDNHLGNKIFYYVR